MQIDYKKTLALLKGGLLDHEATWKSYLDENPGWQQTALVLTGPLIVANVLLSLIFSRLIGGFAVYGYYANFFTTLFFSLVMAAIGFTIAVFVFNFLAGTFKGTPNFSRAFAALSLAAIPAWVAGILAGLIPWLGFIVALAGGILSLVFVYRIMPLALNIPNDKRTIHLVVSIVVIIIANAIVGTILGRGAIGSDLRTGGILRDGSVSRPVAGSGMIGEMARQGHLVEAASADIYDPPRDGKLDEEQVEDYIAVLRKTRVLHDDYARKMEKLAADIKAKEDAGESASPADLARMYSSVGTAVSANNAEMEVVKTGGGNWAEHQWIRQQLRVARIQQGDGTDANAHNYKLYERHKEDLEGG